MQGDGWRGYPLWAPGAAEALPVRTAPYWAWLSVGRHLGIHRPDDRSCNWTARILTTDKRYRQKCLGPALATGHMPALSFEGALERAGDWFREVEAIASEPRPLQRTEAVAFSPIGDVYTVGHALRDYTAWTRITHTPGGHYNILVLINYHLAYDILFVPVEVFGAKDLQVLAERILETAPRFGFEPHRAKVPLHELTPDELRRRKRTYNSLVTILRMAFRHAWESGHVGSDRSWRGVRRVRVPHRPRSAVLSRSDCQALLAHCTPALRQLVLAGLYTGCRVGELARLRVSDVLDAMSAVRVAPFKTGPERTVFLPEAGMTFFAERCGGKAAGDLVLLSDRGRPWRRQHAGLFRRAVAHAGLNKELVFHSLRHTYASDLISNGASLQVVAAQLGHADVRTVSSTYGHLAAAQQAQQVRASFSDLQSGSARPAISAPTCA